MHCHTPLCSTLHVCMDCPSCKMVKRTAQSGWTIPLAAPLAHVFMEPGLGRIDDGGKHGSKIRWSCQKLSESIRHALLTQQGPNSSNVKWTVRWFLHGGLDCPVLQLGTSSSVFVSGDVAINSAEESNAKADFLAWKLLPAQLSFQRSTKGATGSTASRATCSDANVTGHLP
jgi:hypothetical protein